MNRIESHRKHGESFDIAIVVSLFNQAITEKLLAGALEALQQAGFSSEQVTVVEVPGAIEIPLTVQMLAKKNKFGAILALGAVIRGETTHYDYVCQQVSAGCLEVMLRLEIPVIFGVLTTETEAQALDRVGGAHGHKGYEAVDAALSMYQVLKAIRRLP